MDRCTVCGGSATAAAHAIGDFTVVRCRSCGHRYVAPVPDQAVFDAMYGEGYFQNAGLAQGDEGAYFGYADYLADRPNLEARLQPVLDRIARHVAPGTLLDVGCGPGFFVDLARRSGWDARGIEPNRSAVEWGHELGIDGIEQGSTADVVGTFDCVTVLDVLEHVEDPSQLVADASRLVRPDGLLVVITPDAGSPLARLLGAHWNEVKRVPEHLHFFTRRGLSRLLADHGFAPLEWHTTGKVTTVHGLLTDAKVYAPRLVGTIDGWLQELGWDGRVINFDPRTKVCMYARRTSEPAVHSTGAAPVRVPRRQVRIGGGQERAQSFSERQREYWEHRDRFRDPRHPGPEAFSRPKLDWAFAHLDLAPGALILDVGAGNGTVTWYLAERGSVVGVDLSRNLLRRAPLSGRMVEADARRLPFPDASFDLVVESNFLHHVDDPVAVLGEMRRVARRHLVLIEPNRFHPPMALFMALSRPDWRGLRFDASFVRELSVRAGLRVVACAPQGAVYPNATPAALTRATAVFDRPSALGAYVTAVLEKSSAPSGR